MSKQLSEQRLVEIAASLRYPPTPNIVGATRRRLSHPQRAGGAGQRRLAWALIVALLLLASLLAVPQVRAALRDIFRLGAITIFVGEPAAPPTATPAAALAPIPGTPGSASPATATPFQGALRPLAQSTPVTLLEAQDLFAAPLTLPAYPPDLGAPDGVYVNAFDGDDWPALLIFLWRDTAQPEQARLTLYQIQAADFGYKLAEQVVETTVNGREAVWIDSPHFFRAGDGTYYPWQFVPGPVLIWEESGVTYRLEGAPSLDEAVRIAESLQPQSLGPESAPEPPQSCPVTGAPDPPFIPPAPYPAQPAGDYFWYGGPELWTSLPASGAWPDRIQGRKLAWWREGFDGTVEEQPALALSARRLDGPAPEVHSHPRGTNALHPDFHWAMLNGMELPTAGCWEITGRYQGHELSYVIWIPTRD